jgi:two-component system, OmpR family, sensor kinase
VGWGEGLVGRGSVAPGEWPETVRDLIGVTTIGLGVVGLVLLAGQSSNLPADDLQDLLVLGTVGLGTAAALLGDISGRLSGDVRPSWIAAALALYTLVVVPSGTLWPEIVEDHPTIAVAVRSVAFAVILALLAVAVRPPAELGHWAPWLGAGAGALLVIAAGQAAAMFPVPLSALTPITALSGALTFAWLLTSCWLLAHGLLSRDPAVWWMALGMLLVAAAHLHRVSTGTEFEHPEPGFGAIRLVGVLIMLVGTLRLVRGRVQAVRTENWELEEELRIAATHLQRARTNAAERDHELRNGLAGLAGITHLLSAGGGTPEQEQLRTAVLHELSRLAAMVEGERVAAVDPAAEAGFDVTSVLADAVLLRRADGLAIELDSQPGLRAAGRPSVLAQVISNLLGNCAQHAPGTPVRVHARAAGPRIVVEVADDGPGVPRGLERLVLRRGVRNPRSTGDGLGLHVSHELLTGAGGSLQVLPSTGSGGCTVVLELPRVTTEPALPERPAHAPGPASTGSAKAGSRP